MQDRHRLTGLCGVLIGGQNIIFTVVDVQIEPYMWQHNYTSSE